MIINLTKNKVIAESPLFALDFFTRTRGLIFKDFDGFDAMVFPRCNCIHTIFMQISIDLIFIDMDNKICALRSKQRPWTPFIRVPKARTVIELPVGILDTTKSELGDILNIDAEMIHDEFSEVSDILTTPDLIIPINVEKEK